MLAIMRRIDGEKVRAARDGAFLSQGELAKMASLNRNTINRIENRGILEVHPRTIRKVAEALSIDPSSLTPEGE
jgi:DNA-binding XRE family transcriptional regulator